MREREREREREGGVCEGERYRERKRNVKTKRLPLFNSLVTAADVQVVGR